jgi:PAS domain S-box-containing protein
VSLIVENIIIIYGQDTVLVSGFIEKEFREENKTWHARDAQLGRTLENYRRQVADNKKQPHLVSGQFRYRNHDFLVVAAGMPLQKKYAAMILYSDSARVLEAAGVNHRRALTLYTAGGVSMVLLAVALFVLFNLRRDRAAFATLHTMSEDLIREISDHQFTEQRLAQSEATLKGIFKAAPIGIGTINQGFLGWMNDSLCRITGYSLEDIQGRRADMFFASESAFRAFRDVLSSGFDAHGAASGEAQIRTRNGASSHVLVHAAFIDESEPDLGIIFTMVDMTEQRAATRALRDSEARFRALLENLADGVFCHDMDGRFVLVNEAVCRMTGYTRQELTSLSVTDIDARLVDRSNARFWTALSPGESVTIETAHKRRDGSEYPVEIRLNRLTLDDRPVILALARDITDRAAADHEKKRLQSQLLQSQKMEAVGRLAGGIAHDFNNMLAVIMGSAQLALMDAGPGHPLHEDIHEIKLAAERARDLTMKLLAFARKDKLNVRPMSVRRAIEELAPMLERTVAKRVQVRFGELSDSMIAIDKTQIHQALLNICLNAADAMPQGGDIHISAVCQTFLNGVCDSCGQDMAGDFCRIRIRDTGAGMPEDVRARVLEPFFTTKGVGKGTGLGLSVTHGIVTGHGGHIIIRSRTNEGTTVDIFLPLDHTDTQPDQKPVSANRAWSGTETILVIDDEHHVLSMSDRLLRAMGFKTVLAWSGPQGLEQFHAQRAQIDLVLLDMIMPGMDGVAVLQELRNADPHVKVVICTGYSLDDQSPELERLGFQGFVQKPFTLETLGKTVRRALDA